MNLVNRNMFTSSGKRIIQFLAPRKADKGIMEGDRFRKVLNPEPQDINETERFQEMDTMNTLAVENIDLSFFKILVAEDNLINQKILQQMFQRMELQYKIVANGQEVLDALRSEPFDFVMMDCYMEPLNGFETGKLIRESEERFHNIPLIAFTAGTLDGELERSYRALTDDFLLKPISFDHLRKKMREWAYRIYEKLAILDVSALDKIRIFDDEHQTLLRSLYQLYSENTQEELYKLRDLILDGAAEPIRKKAHMLKSSAAQLGAHRLEKFCILMEHEEGLEPERAKKIFSELSREYDSSRKRFSEYCQSLGQSPHVLM